MRRYAERHTGGDPAMIHDGTPVARTAVRPLRHGRARMVLTHGCRFNKENWKKRAETLAASGFLALAMRFAETLSIPTERRVLSALLQTKQWVCYWLDVEASAGTAACSLEPIVLLASGGDVPKHLRARKLFIVARGGRNSSGRMAHARLSGSFAKRHASLSV